VLQVHHPNVEQMVAVAAHSFTAADLLRVERILLDALEFNIAAPTAYGCLHLLTQVRELGTGSKTVNGLDCSLYSDVCSWTVTLPAPSQAA